MPWRNKKIFDGQPLSTVSQDYYDEIFVALFYIFYLSLSHSTLYRGAFSLVQTGNKTMISCSQDRVVYDDTKSCIRIDSG